MKHIRIGNIRTAFEPMVASRSAQMAMMSLRPGEASDDHPRNEHPRSEQWLLVLAGNGVATIGKRGSTRRVKLAPNSLLLIEKGERHRIKNAGRKLLRTVNLYVPPAYKPDGNLRPR
ncbi:MAG TPA: cupin domain-containing protein [Pirellulales bacterium]|jgi:mannose-6-phosphate isomerase-like protein (cupin superfamily)